MVKKEANLTAIMLVQQLEPKFWHTWEDTSPIVEAKNGNCKPLLEAIVKRLADNDIEVVECYAIIHGKDKRTVWSQEKMKNIVEDKELHIHVLMKFKKGASLKNLAVTIGVETQYLEKLKSGRYGYDNSLAYLIHSKDENKHQYSPEEVFTLLGEDYKSVYSRRIDTWLKGRAKKEIDEITEIKNWLILEVLKGNITKDNILLNDKYYVVYASYKRLVNEAFDTYYEKKSLRIINDLEQGKFKKTIIFISGASGVGKTKFAKEIIRLLKNFSFNCTGKAWEHCVTASTNAFDEYYSQEILFLDDIRGDSLSLVDWLKLLDPFSISPISARYHNKQAVAKTIITSPHKPCGFFHTVEKAKLEDFDQFYRRIDLYIEIDNDFHISTVEKKEITEQDKKRVYLESNKKYKYVFTEAKSYPKDKITRIIMRKIMNNMKWNKEDYPPTDQSKKDNL